MNPRTTFNNTRFHIGEVQGGSAPWPGLIDEFRISDSIVYDMNSNFTPPTAPFAAPSSGVAGDYNNNGKVDAADYTVWRDNLGTSNVLPNDSTPGIVNSADYTVWKNNFGLPGAGAAAVGRCGARTDRHRNRHAGVFRPLRAEAANSDHDR